MQTIEAQFEIVTPMFISGANNEADLRPPSIKGALRFWWRALHWGQCLQDCQQDTGKALKRLYGLEAELFGAAVKDDKYGQGSLFLKLKPGFPNKQFVADTSKPGVTYLLGQGLFHFKKGYLKPALAAKQCFTLILKVRDNDSLDGVIDSLLLWGLLGGLGSRARKGLGSVAIRSLLLKENHKNVIKEIEIPKTKEEYVKTIQSLLRQINNGLPPFTALSGKTRIDISEEGSHANTLLNKIGMEMQLYRSYGKNSGKGHKVAGRDAEQNFKSDHDNVLNFIKTGSIKEHPKRVIFGLPHNYFYSSISQNVDVLAVDTTMNSNKKESQHRRSSPLFIHIHRFNEKECIAVQALIQAEFLPEKYQIQLFNKKSKKKVSLPCKVNWDDIQTYLNRFKHREEII